jgi:hypothetical protein
MKTWLLYAIVASLLALLLFAGIHVYLESQASSKPADIFFGVDAAYDNVESLKQRVDEVKSYTNFFIIGSYGITFNETKLNDMCQYIYDNGLSFAIFAHTLRGANITFDQAAWARYAEERWGERFWGLYAYDEPGGHQVDHDTEYMAVRQADNYSDAANKFVEKLSSDALVDFIPLNSPLMTSDYALYDFDYKAGYDVVLAELAWNHSRPINIGLCRGAATANGKDWGVMITYTYTTPPYLASGEQIFNDLVLAYENGAKYFMVFDYAKDPTSNVTHGILQPEHLEAMQRFWEYVKHNPRPDETGERVAYVLPNDYAYGFRGPSDSIWGLWGPDDLSSKVWSDVNALVEQHGEALDVIYEDALQNHTLPYNKAVFWNGTILMH